VEEDNNEGLAIGGPLVCKCWSVVHQALQDCLAIDAIPPSLLPFQECLPIDRGCAISRDVLGGGFVVVVDHKTHVPNQGNILRPILGIEDKVRNFFATLVNCNSSGGRFGRSRILPKLIKWPLLFNLNPLLRSLEEAGDSAALEKNGDKPLPPMGCHITAKGDEIINTPARFGVDKGHGNVF
jgi:hypothetical protein